MRRDVQLLKAVNTYRVLHRGHISNLFFAGVNDEGGSARRRLSQLFDQGYLERIPRFISPPHNSPGPAYRLAARGAALLADLAHVPFAEFNYWGKTEDADGRSPRLGHAYIEHNLLLAEIRMKFEMAAPECGCTVTTWLDYHDLRPSWKTERVRVALSDFGTTEDVAIAPDGYFVLVTGQGRGHFFVEADRGTESVVTAWKRKILVYKAYLRSGKFHERYAASTQTGFRVLTLTPSLQRAEHLRKAAEAYGASDQAAMFLFTDSPRFLTSSLDSRIWLRGSLNTAQSLIEPHAT